MGALTTERLAPLNNSVMNVRGIADKSDTRPRVLVGIASYGKKNLGFLRRIIQGYKAMSMNMDIVVFSESPKEIEENVEVRVGLPSADPWSLPFAHKALFAERCAQYDLFIYSEDDIEVREEHIVDFIKLSDVLEADEIAGFDLYETEDSKEWWLPGFHGHFRWKPESVRRCGEFTIAEFSNEHAGFYILTQEQLKRCIASGGYLKEPSAGRYDMLCTAATDPYTSCGFRKVMCLSNFDRFLLRHLPNRYIEKQGVPLSVVQEQIEALLEIGKGERRPIRLCETETKVSGARWSKRFYEPPAEDVLSLVPQAVKKVLSIGCGFGQTEAALVRRGVLVSGLPLDSVIGACAAQRGIKVVDATLAEGATKFATAEFDCIVITNLLHLFEYPAQFLDEYRRVLRPGGYIVMSGPNFEYLPLQVKRIAGAGEMRKIGNYVHCGVNALGMGSVVRLLAEAGFDPEAIIWRAAQHGVTLSGSVHVSRGPRQWIGMAWKSLVRSGMLLDAKLWRRQSHSCGRIRGRPGLGRFFAENWTLRARFMARSVIPETCSLSPRQSVHG